MPPNWPDRLRQLYLFAAILAGLGLLLLVALPSITLLFQANGRDVPPQLARWLPALEPVYGGLLWTFLGVWIVFFGGCLASFLNVVAWRLPRGMSILGRSHCPRCGTQLSLKENLPIFGWLSCGGQCRYCSQPIPIRYFLVELIFGLMLLGLGLIELATRGFSVPRQLLDAWPADPFQLIPTGLLWLFAGHVFLLSLLYACVLIRFDSRRIPWSILMVGLAGALVLFAFSPAYRSVFLLGWNWIGPIGSSPIVSAIGSLAGGLAGAAAGWGLGAWTAAGNSHRRKFGAREASIGLTLIGVLLGFWPLLMIALLQTIVRLAMGRGRSQPITFSASVLAVTFLFLIVWRWLF